MKKKNQETKSCKATFEGDKLVVNGKICFDYDIPKKWLPAVNTSVNIHWQWYNWTYQEPLSSQFSILQIYTFHAKSSLVPLPYEAI